MKESRVLRVTPIPPRVDNRLLVDVEYSCSSCEGSGVVRLTAVDWMDGKDIPRANYKCAKCRGVVLKLIRPAKGKKMTNFELLENAGFKKIPEIPYSWWIHLGLRLGFSFGGVRDANPAWLEDRTSERDRKMSFFSLPRSQMAPPPNCTTGYSQSLD
jgi:hypothetical protein